MNCSNFCTLSYLCFILKEIKELINLKFSYNIYYYELRKKQDELKDIKKKLKI